MKPFIAVGLAGALGVGGAAVGLAVGIGAGIGICSSGNGNGSPTPATSTAPNTPSQTSTATASPTPTGGAELAFDVPSITSTNLPASVVAHLKQINLQGATYNQVLWTETYKQAGASPTLFVSEVMTSDLESGFNDNAVGEGSEGDWQIQLDVLNRDVTSAQARDPIFSTNWIQQLWRPAYRNQSASDLALWKTDPMHAAANLAFNAEHPQDPYWDVRHAAVVTSWNVAVQIVAAYGIDTSSWPLTDLPGSVSGDGTDGGCSDNSASTTADTIGTGSVYQLGDSLSVGMVRQGGLESLYNSRKIQVPKVEATEGIGISAATAKLQADASEIKAADTVVIELGTNDYKEGVKQDQLNIDALVSNLKTINPALSLYWVNAYSASPLVNVAHINGAIEARADPDGYKVIDWNKEGANNRSKYSFDSLGVHPTTVEGWQGMAAFIVDHLPQGSTAAGQRGAVTQAARRLLGAKYSYAGGGYDGLSPGACSFGAGWNDCHVVGIDCSGLVMYAFHQAKVYDFPHSAAGQYQLTSNFTVVPAGGDISKAQPGDLIFFEGAAAPGHVAIYVGNGFEIEAPQSGDVVKYIPVPSDFTAITDPFAWRASLKAA